MTQGPPLISVGGDWHWVGSAGESYSPPTLLDYRGLATDIVSELAVVVQDLAGKSPMENRRVLKWLRDTLQKGFTNVASHTAERCRDIARNTDFSKDERAVNRGDIEAAIQLFGTPEANTRQRYRRDGRSESSGSVFLNAREIPEWEAGVITRRGVSEGSGIDYDEEARQIAEDHQARTVPSYGGRRYGR